jgi:hypothetical protein
VNQIGFKGEQVINHQLLMAGKQRIAVETFIDGKGSEAALEFQRLDRSVLGESGLVAAAHNEQRKIARTGEFDQVPAKRCHTVSFEERIGKQGNAWRGNQCGRQNEEFY